MREGCDHPGLKADGRWCYWDCKQMALNGSRSVLSADALEWVGVGAEPDPYRVDDEGAWSQPSESVWGQLEPQGYEVKVATKWEWELEYQLSGETAQQVQDRG